MRQEELKTDLNKARTIDDFIQIIDRYSAPPTAAGSKSELGRTSYVVTAKGDQVETGFTVVEASELIPSHTLDGQINPAFPQELQPRDRTNRQSSIEQIHNIANNLDPVRLADSGLSSHGAPIIGSDRVVESGNGRTIAIIKGYAEGKGEAYKQYLVDNAALYALEPSKVESMRSPVLVRVRTSEVDREKFARDSNLSDLNEMTSSEKAWVDSELISTNMMDLFNPGDSGNLLSKDNQSFIHSFMTEIGRSASAGLMTADGRPTKQLIDRMQNAIFAKAYKNDDLVRLVSEEADPEIRNVLTALNGAASSFVQMQHASGEVHKQVTDQIVDVLNVPKIPADEIAKYEKALNAAGRNKKAIKQFAIELGIGAITKDIGQHNLTDNRVLKEAAIYYNPDRPNVPIVVTKADIANLGLHRLDAIKASVIARIDAILPAMRFTDDQIATYHKAEKNSDVIHWESAKVKLDIDGKRYQVELKLKFGNWYGKRNLALKPYMMDTPEQEDMINERMSDHGRIADLLNAGSVAQLSGGQSPLIDDSRVTPGSENVNAYSIDSIEVNEIPSLSAKEPGLADEALDSLIKATELVRQAKDSGQSIEELVNQSDLFGENNVSANALAMFISANNRSAKRLTSAFKAMADAINNELINQASSQGGGLFGDELPPVTLVDVLGQVSQQLEIDFGEYTLQQSMFESVQQLREFYQ
ncbi:hypothetical protein [Thaumasiovibrio sp. DFM-14]|uniref:hypothetical protein n=1 Tax=Thaumasiovibrio sp. DFM-14 TaxID=3384792 RepID=UPI0039A31EB2